MQAYKEERLDKILEGEVTVLETRTAKQMDFLFDDIATTLYSMDREFTFKEVTPTKIEIVVTGCTCPDGIMCEWCTPF